MSCGILHDGHYSTKTDVGLIVAFSSSDVGAPAVTCEGLSGVLFLTAATAAADRSGLLNLTFYPHNKYVR